MIHSSPPFPDFDELTFFLSSSSIFTLFTSLITPHTTRSTKPLACCRTSGFPFSTLRRSRAFRYEESCLISLVRSKRMESIMSRFSTVLFARAVMRDRMSRRWLWISRSLDLSSFSSCSICCEWAWEWKSDVNHDHDDPACCFLAFEERCEEMHPFSDAACATDVARARILVPSMSRWMLAALEITFCRSRRRRAIAEMESRYLLRNSCCARQMRLRWN